MHGWLGVSQYHCVLLSTPVGPITVIHKQGLDMKQGMDELLLLLV
jgi:hypothetical protein